MRGVMFNGDLKATAVNQEAWSVADILASILMCK